MKRWLGRRDDAGTPTKGIEVSAIGLGSWAIGGAMLDETGSGHSWGYVDDDDAVSAMQWAMDAGITFFDTSNNYGCGHAERLIGRAIAGRRDEVVLASKFGYRCQAESRIIVGEDIRPAAIREMLAQSLANLGTDRLDLYQLHIASLELDEALRVRDLLETLVDEGQIGGYGWSCNNADKVTQFAEGDNCLAIQHHLNLFERTQSVLDVCERMGVTSIARGPLAMGLLTGKYTANTVMPADDFRHDWNLQDGREGQQLVLLERIRNILTKKGHSLPQAALAWLLSYGDTIVPIPGFKTLAQVQDTVGVLEKGRLDASQMDDLAELLTLEAISVL
ncbi:MAG: aldo/keto reductase [Deinococcota bacterium]